MKFDIFYYFLVCTTRYITDTKQIKTLTGKIMKGTIQTHLFTALVWAFFKKSGRLKSCLSYYSNKWNIIPLKSHNCDFTNILQSQSYGFFLSDMSVNRCLLSVKNEKSIFQTVRKRDIKDHLEYQVSRYDLSNKT